MRKTLFVALGLFAPLLSTAAPARAQAVPAAPSVALVNDRQLMLRRRHPDGSLGAAAPYAIRGVGWSPASRGTNTSKSDPNNANVRRAEFATWAAADIPLLKAMNVNTVRLFIDPGTEAAGRAVLDELYRNGIMVVMTVDDAVNNTARAQQVVSFYRDHPAVLMWSLGSEWNINYYFGVASGPRDAAQRTEAAAALVKSLDPNHPVATSYGEIDIDSAELRLADTADYVNNVCRSVDVWGLNVYRGNSFGALFAQWKSITGKPMYLGEFGTDAWRTPPSLVASLGVADELMQAQWDATLWNELAKNLSAADPSKAALGGTVFVSNDEWWKVSPAGSQQADGFWFVNAHPDDFANEEYFGIFDIDRRTRRAYDSFKTLYAPGAQPTRTALFRAASRGAVASEYGHQNGVAYLFDRGRIVYRKDGGGGGGRGFNVLAVHPSTGQPLGPGQNFDTYASRSDGAAHAALINYLDGLPAGTLVLLAVGDEAGLNGFETCASLSFIWTENLYRALEALGSRSIRNYCYWDSWAMAAFKGEGQAVEESLGKGVEVSASAAVNLVSTVQFAAASGAAGEGAGSVQLTVTRAGDLSNESVASYRTADQTADERSDYNAARGTLRFAPGEQSKTVSVALVNDVRVEPAETFAVILEAPAGAALGAPSATAITINSDDTSPPAPADNPSRASQFFVRQHYVDFLNREPDAPGLEFWTQEIEQCGQNAQCREVKRINVSAAFFLSIEFQQTGYLVYLVHQAAFGTGETLRLSRFLADTQEIGRGVVVNQGEWERQIEANKREFADRFVARPEFEAALPSALSATQYVDALNARTNDPAQPSAGGSLTQAERDLLAADLVAGRKTRAQVLRAVAEHAEFRRRQFNKAFVLMQYFGYLRRNPNDPPDSDFNGFNFWLAKLNQFGGNYVEAEMVRAFITSLEYGGRFGPV